MDFLWTYFRGSNQGSKWRSQGLISRVSGLRSQVSGLWSQVSVLRSQVSGLRSQVSGLRPQVLGLRSQVSEVIDHLSFDVHNTLAGSSQIDFLMIDGEARDATFGAAQRNAQGRWEGFREGTVSS